MPTPAAFLLLALLAATLTLASCGEEDAQLLPGGTAREITANLDTVKQLADEGDCLGAESATLQVSEQVEAIEGVDARLQRALEQGAARLNEVVASCEEESEAAVPEVTETELEPGEGEKAEKAQEKEEKEREEAEKAQEKEEKSQEKEEAEQEEEPSLPPQAGGEGKGLDNENGSGPGGGGEGGGTPSGGLGPGSPASGEDN